MARIPTPGDFKIELRTLVQALGYLAHEYEWAYGVAYGRQVVDQAHVAGGRVDRDGDMVRQAADGRDVDPKRSVAFDHAALREALRYTTQQVRRTQSEMDAKVDLLRSTIEKDERRHGPMFDPLRNPREATRKDLEESYEARQRRRDRGEAIP